MASFVINTLQTTTQTLNTAETGTVLRDGAIVTTAAASIDVDGSASLYVSGEVTSFGATAINAFNEQFDLYVDETGSITALRNFAANGSISAGTAVYTFNSPGATLINHGTITSLATAVNLSAERTEFVNHGTISGDNFGVSLSMDALAGLMSFNNLGTIFGLQTGVELRQSNVNATSFVSRLENSGVIEGAELALEIESYLPIDFANTGLLIGDVAFSTFDIAILNNAGGRIEGNLGFGVSDDTYRGRYGEITGTVFSNDGNDLLEMGPGDNYVNAGPDNDTVIGHGGDDTLLGDSGFDTLYGNSGHDVLDGGGRADLLIGGKGDDTLTGGGGGDTFVIRRVGNGDDEVTDFQNGSDRVDISALGVQNFNALNNVFGALSQDTDSVIIDLEAAGGSGSIRLMGMTLADMDASDFIF